MLKLNERNVLTYLQETHRLPGSANAKASLLEWGVSNVVLRIQPDVGEDFVIKQSRAQLRTRDPWFSRLDRIFREMEVMRIVAPLVPEGVVPRILFEDRENYLFAMEAVAANHVVWKQALLNGQVDRTIAERLGTYLAAIHRETSLRPELQGLLGDREVFVQLRIDPFYRRLAAVHPDMEPYISALIEETDRNPLCAVLADFSPKNILIVGPRIALVDFETGHYGDPAFDLGFFLSHLLLKTILHSARFPEYSNLTVCFWQSYLDGIRHVSQDGPMSANALQQRTIPHLAACMWARIDATSQIDYLPDAARKQLVRNFSRSLFVSPPPTWEALLERLQSGLYQISLTP